MLLFLIGHFIMILLSTFFTIFTGYIFFNRYLNLFYHSRLVNLISLRNHPINTNFMNSFLLLSVNCLIETNQLIVFQVKQLEKSVINCLLVIMVIQRYYITRFRKMICLLMNLIINQDGFMVALLIHHT